MTTSRALALAACAALLAACTATPATGPQGTTGPPQPTATASYPAAWPLPDSGLSPGVVGTTDIHEVCPHVDPALEAQRPTSADKAKVYAAYGLAYPQPPGKYELDHVIPIELGGAPNNPRNEYPEVNDTPDPAMLARWHLDAAFVHNSKDITEDVLHQLVCAGTVGLAEAQQAIATDWRAAYVRWVGPALGG